MQSKLWNSYFASSASKALDAISQAVRRDITRYLLGAEPANKLEASMIIEALLAKDD